MARLDPRLQFLRQERQFATATVETASRFGIRPEGMGAEPALRVLLQFDGNVDAARAAGVNVTSGTGNVAAGFTTFEALEALERAENIDLVESSRPMQRELHVSVPEIRADRLHVAVPSRRGAGVLVGIIDSGIDFRHPSFIDPAGGTRIAAIWDQHLTPWAGESSPAPFGYGVEYSRADIDQALAGGGGVRHVDYDPDGHGTHVAGIAAGNGSPASSYVGVAPEADLVVVANLGDSADTLDAVQYLLATASALKRPIVINLSQGDNLGPHDGTAPLEHGIDQLLGGGRGKAMVKSAGNTGNLELHASGTVRQDDEIEVEFEVPPNDFTPDTIDLWYGGGDRLDMAIRIPNGTLSGVVRPGDPATTLALANGNRVFVASTTGNPLNGENRIYLQLLPGMRPEIESGTWGLVLTGTIVVDGRFNAWIENGVRVPSFRPPFVDDSRTITTPGNARRIVTVGAYVTVSATSTVGSLADFSSHGPTRDGRTKPDLCAPGQRVNSARANGTPPNQFHAMSGTSMASPHVSGTVALLLEKRPTLTTSAIATHLTQTCRADAFTQSQGPAEWGAGKLDAEACHAAVP